MTYRYGPEVDEDGVRFRLWAPGADAVDLLIGDRALPMTDRGGGHFELAVVGAGPGLAYRFSIDGGTVPDPATRRQKGDVEGASVVTVPPAARVSKPARPWHEAVIVEVHVGAATPEGTFAALAGRLDHYAALGVTALELLPVADFPGARNWGYDGVLPFAPDESYGTPDDLRRLIDAAHERGLQLYLDVVYNHFGPVGNYLPSYAGAFFTDEFSTPWGSAIDFEREEVRAFFVENAAYWIEEYGFDGLRFDAVHAFEGPGRRLFLDDLARRLRAIDPQPHLILENDHNEASLLGGGSAFDAQWNDDFHHVFHVALTGEHEGYYRAYADDTAKRTARVLAEGFAYQGEPTPNRDGAPRGEPSGHLHPRSFVSFLQNHDQVGNRAFGERLAELAAPERLDLACFALLLSPQIPMLFMGEEFATRRRFPYFCDFEEEFGQLVREGRRKEFSGFSTFSGDDIPDPLSPSTFESAKLDWSETWTSEGQTALARVKALIGLRKTHIVPLLAGAFRGADASAEGGVVECEWRFDGGKLVMALNLSETEGPTGVGRSDPVAAIGRVEPGRLGPWSGALWRS
ncbi:malto-oligosyltrehalose trehalohydrolase [Inquilinus sp. CAU 1745]|uniref:malto-oligosyltrehalose trehalohydrolase n=1 Tax=Inquilinus sp. CAU 1745 TaxID=3140369 RepID=UPI00325AFD02